MRSHADAIDTRHERDILAPATEDSEEEAAEIEATCEAASLAVGCEECGVRWLRG